MCMFLISFSVQLLSISLIRTFFFAVMLSLMAPFIDMDIVNNDDKKCSILNLYIEKKTDG